MRLLVQIVTLLAMAGTGACASIVNELPSSESLVASHSEQVRRSLIAFMPLSTMFEDSDVRALAAAAGNGRTQRVRELVAGGVSVDSRGANGATPLFWALRKQSLSGLSALLDLGADPNIVFDGTTVVHWAARMSDTRYLRVILDHGGDPSIATGPRCETPLFLSVDSFRQHAENTMDVLLDAGADIDATDCWKAPWGSSMGGTTVAMNAAMVLRYDVVLHLLKRGATYEHTNDLNQSLMTLVGKDKDMFPERSKMYKSIHEVISWLVDHGVALP